MMKQAMAFGVTLLAFTQLVYAIGKPGESWLESQLEISRQNIEANISPSDARRGAVVAAPSRSEPDYYYHWVRDAALVYSAVADHDGASVAPKLLDFVEFSAFGQAQQSPGSVGEPKYHVDGTPFVGPWGRPQNDGPALRALTLMRNFHLYVANNQQAERAWSVISRDLDYVADQALAPCFDLWEEIKGYHFYTRVVQRHALLWGAEFAERVGAPHKAAWYRTQADLIGAGIQDHLSYSRGIIVENIQRQEGIHYKDSGLDTASVLALLHTKDAPPIEFSHDFTLNTVESLIRVFYWIYPINSRFPELGVAIGRYPEDRYYGGNPWFLTTLALAEYHFELARELLKKSNLELTENSRRYFRGILGAILPLSDTLTPSDLRTVAERALQYGDLFLARVQFHTDETGQMSEQMDRDTGYLKAAPHLTWSYASYLTAIQSRQHLLKELGR